MFTTREGFDPIAVESELVIDAVDADRLLGPIDDAAIEASLDGGSAPELEAR